jgi:hypothetical protein
VGYNGCGLVNEDPSDSNAYVSERILADLFLILLRLLIAEDSLKPLPKGDELAGSDCGVL